MQNFNGAPVVEQKEFDIFSLGMYWYFDAIATENTDVQSLAKAIEHFNEILQIQNSSYRSIALNFLEFCYKRINTPEAKIHRNNVLFILNKEASEKMESAKNREAQFQAAIARAEIAEQNVQKLKEQLLAANDRAKNAEQEISKQKTEFQKKYSESDNKLLELKQELEGLEKEHTTLKTQINNPVQMQKLQELQELKPKLEALMELHEHDKDFEASQQKAANEIRTIQEEAAKIKMQIEQLAITKSKEEIEKEKRLQKMTEKLEKMEKKVRGRAKANNHKFRKIQREL